MARLAFCLDPGHGGRDPGATAGGLRESDLTLAVALAVRRILVPKYRVILIREEDTAVLLRERVEIARRERADAFVSIHANAAAGPASSGYEVLVRRDPLPESLVLAGTILGQFAKRWPSKPNRGVRHRELAVLRQPIPSCLVECFFLSNPNDRLLLSSPREQARIAEAIAWGCGNFARAILPAV